MKVIVTANIVPFLAGGADYHISGLIEQLKQSGHEVEAVRFPFRFSPLKDIEQLMAYCQQQNFNRMNGVEIDKVISLQFPSYGVQHDEHTVWIMHQHRAAYELYDQQPASRAMAELKQNIHNYDNQVLGRAQKLFANSQCVADRLKNQNQLVAEPLYHPPYLAEQFYCEADYGYIFCPSRLESLKRQNLLIEAMKYCKTPVKVIIAGDGGQREPYQALIEKEEVADKVRLIGRCSEAEKLAYYAHALAVFFAPYDEDYGYITLEAMLSAKAVITCKDSGGPLEFIQHEENGFILEPEAEQIAEVLDRLYLNKNKAKMMGEAGLERYRLSNINWDNVVEKLLSPA